MRTIILSLLFIFSISLAHAEELVLYRFVSDLSTLKVGDQLVIANPGTHEAMGKFPISGEVIIEMLFLLTLFLKQNYL